MSIKAKWNECYRDATGERQASRVLKENLQLSTKGAVTSEFNLHLRFGFVCHRPLLITRIVMNQQCAGELL
jgi:hypothetical protein